MKEELTTKMHSEFVISKQEEILLRCWSALTMITNIKDEAEVLEWAELYNVSVEDIKRNAKEFYKLKQK